MGPLWAPLAAGFLKRIEKELGEEATLALLWPQVVGPELAQNTQLKAIRRGTLIVTVPDREWLRSIGSLEAIDRMILDAIGRLGTGKKYDAVEFVLAPLVAVPQVTAQPRAGRVDNTARETAHAIDTAIIGDDSLRARFENSAKKYFAPKPRGAA